MSHFLNALLRSSTEDKAVNIYQCVIVYRPVIFIDFTFSTELKPTQIEREMLLKRKSKEGAGTFQLLITGNAKVCHR